MKKILFLLLLCIVGVANAFALAQTVRMNIGDTKTLSPSVLPTEVLAGQPAWTSSRPYDVKIVSTDMYTCTIEAVKSFSGYALIHCLYYFRELDPVTGRYGYQRSGYVDYHVFVEAQDPKSIEISPTNIVMTQGDTHRMSVTVYPSAANQSVTWSSSDYSVASVNSNNVLGANRAGTAVITATTSNGLRATCSVTVKSAGSGGGNTGGGNTGGGNTGGNTGGDNGGNNNDNSQIGPNNDTVDYYFQIAKRRMDALRRKAKQHRNKK